MRTSADDQDQPAFALHDVLAFALSLILVAAPTQAGSHDHSHNTVARQGGEAERLAVWPDSPRHATTTTPTSTPSPTHNNVFSFDLDTCHKGHDGAGFQVTSHTAGIATGGVAKPADDRLQYAGQQPMSRTGDSQFTQSRRSTQGLRKAAIKRRMRQHSLLAKRFKKTTEYNLFGNARGTKTPNRDLNHSQSPKSVKVKSQANNQIRRQGVASENSSNQKGKTCIRLRFVSETLQKQTQQTKKKVEPTPKRASTRHRASTKFVKENSQGKDVNKDKEAVLFHTLDKERLRIRGPKEHDDIIGRNRPQKIIYQTPHDKVGRDKAFSTNTKRTDQISFWDLPQHRLVKRQTDEEDHSNDAILISSAPSPSSIEGASLPLNLTHYNDTTEDPTENNTTTTTTTMPTSESVTATTTTPTNPDDSDSHPPTAGRKGKNVWEKGILSKKKTNTILEILYYVVLVLVPVAIVMAVVNVVVFLDKRMKTRVAALLVAFNATEGCKAATYFIHRIWRAVYGTSEIQWSSAYVYYFCYFVAWAPDALGRISLILNLIITVDRFLVLAFPMQTVNRRLVVHPRLTVGVVVAAMFAFNSTNLFLILAYISGKGNATHRFLVSEMVSEMYVVSPHAVRIYRILHVTSSVCFRYVPLIFTIVLNIMTIASLVRRARGKDVPLPVKDAGKVATSGDGDAVATASSTVQSHSTARKRQNNLMIVGSTLTFSFLVAVKPLIRIVAMLHPSFGEGKVDNYLYMVCNESALVLDNSSPIVNFLSYVKLSSAYRQVLVSRFWRRIGDGWKTKLSEKMPSSEDTKDTK